MPEDLAQVVEEVVGLLVGQPEGDLPVSDGVGARVGARLVDVACEGRDAT